jgi:outer membrane protein assembly factor BamB
MNTSRGGIHWPGYASPPRPVRRLADAESPPIVVGDVAAYVSPDYTLNVCDYRTGQPQWKARLQREEDLDAQMTPAVAGDVLCATSPGWVAGFRLSTGEPIWELGVDPVVSGTPSVVDRTVFVAGGESSFLACDATTGKVRWERQLTRDEFRGVTAGTAVADGTVFVPCTDGLVHGIDAATGKRNLRWPAVVGDDFFPPICVQGDVVVACSGDRLYGIDVPTGERRWRRRLEETVNGLALGEGSVLACTRSSVCALTVGDGQVRWQTRLKGTVGEPSVAGDVIVVPSGFPHRLYAVALQTGRRLWEVPLTSEPSCAAVVAGDSLLITAGGNIEVFAFGQPAQARR